MKQLWCPLPSLHQNPCTLGQVLLLNNYKFIGTIDYVCLPFYLRYGFKNLDTLNKRVFWNLEGYYIQLLEFTRHPHNLCAPWDIYRSLNPLFWWWKGAMMAYQLTLVLVFYFFMPTYIYLNVNICSMHICTRGPQMSWIQKMQFHFSKSNFLVPKNFDLK